MRPSGLAARGLTLIELMMGVSLLSVVALGFGTVYGTAQTSLVDAMARDHADRGLSHAMEHLTRHLRQAEQAVFTDAEGLLTVTLPPRGPHQDPWNPGASRTMVYHWHTTCPEAGGGALTPSPQRLIAVEGARCIVVADGITRFQVLGADAKAMSAKSATATVTLAVQPGNRPIERTSTVQLRGWTPLPKATN